MFRKGQILNKAIRGLIIFLIAGSGVMAGCTNPVATTRSVQDAAPQGILDLPTYIPGTVFVYASGRWDTVENVDKDSVQWLNHRGDRSVGSHDFTFRPLSWESKTHEGTRTFEHAQFVFGRKAYSLWPLSVGKTSGYFEINKWHPKGGPFRTYRAYWSCEVEGDAKVTVPAGKFDTLKVACARFSGKNSSSTAFAREYRAWYYAPEINHWVAYEREYRGEDRRVTRKRLAAILPVLERDGISDSDRVEMDRFFQNSLQTSQEGVTHAWHSGSGVVQMDMTQMQTFQRNDRTTCRQYQQTLIIEGKREKYYGVACKGVENKWNVPQI
ncbi:hypothetical protein [Desulfopila sp. IMCC35008]|uniref:hypothetical protein n=1 Tax=Desulfopila sp. IMCC35008 TaxID=2653858 RepID=UPI0013D6A9B3|nr:hypothetical protein [Desulfopila sp. IMCC35008]